MKAMVGEIGSNPRYAAYAQAHGRTPDEMMEHDRAAWPGGCMCGFIVWMSEQKQAFWKACQSAFLDRYTIRDQIAWTAFLQSVANSRLIAAAPELLAALRAICQNGGTATNEMLIEARAAIARAEGRMDGKPPAEPSERFCEVGGKKYRLLRGGYGLTVDEAQRQAAQTADKLDGKGDDHGQA